jgi:menaquinone-specific isochorismate synthase
VETDLRLPAQTDRLVIQTVAVPDPGDLISQLPEPGALAWVRRGEGLVGWGEVARITLPAGEDRFTVGEKWLRSLLDTAEIDDRVGVPGSGPVAFGSFTFDPASDGSVLVLPATVLGRRNGQAWLTTIGSVQPAHADQAEATGPARAHAAGAGVVDGRVPVTTPGDVSWHEGSQSAAQWEEAVAAAVDRIKSGALRKVVLARDLYATAPVDLDVRALLGRLAARYPDCYTFGCAGLVGATPELLIRREGTQISALVLAGTIPRGSTPGRDEALGAALLASVKDREEHDYAATGVRETLAPLCARLTMDDTPFLLRLANVQHLATSVTGTLAAPRQTRTGRAGHHGEPGAEPGARHSERGRRPEPPPSALALAAALHPTAAVCGTPTETAMELIRELEGMDRGRYAGPVGWVDAHGNGEWGIAMRCAELDGRRARLFAGCGIVAGSQPGAEQAEAQAKFRPMQDALEGRQP